MYFEISTESVKVGGFNGVDLQGSNPSHCKTATAPHGSCLFLQLESPSRVESQLMDVFFSLDIHDHPKLLEVLDGDTKNLIRAQFLHHFASSDARKLK